MECQIRRQVCIVHYCNDHTPSHVIPTSWHIHACRAEQSCSAPSKMSKMLSAAALARPSAAESDTDRQRRGRHTDGLAQAAEENP